MWIFGYGSLLWKQNFPYEDCVIGHVKGFKRRFWLLNTDHRGIPEQPGRVVTLVEDPDQKVWGVAFKIPDAEVQNVRSRLAVREKDYATHLQNFYPRDRSKGIIKIMLYIASPEHPNFQPAENHKIAKDIKRSVGPSGTNLEYLLKLADYVRRNISEDRDEHLFHLERLVKVAIAA